MKLERGEIKDAILSALALAGIIVVSLTAPNLLQIFSGYGQFPKSRNDNVRRSIRSMQKKGFVKYKNSKLSITKHGRQELLLNFAKSVKLENTKSDGKIRIVVFDIPVNQNRIRMFFTRKLKELGFKYLQKSVWIINCPCEKEIKNLSQLLGISQYVSVFRGELV